MLIVLIFGVTLLYMGTDGFSAYTAEGARTITLMKEKPAFPDVVLQDSKQRTFDMKQFEGKLVLATFMYTSCGTVCPVLQWNLSEVYEAIPKEYIGKKIVFLSITFDNKHDTVAKLEQYRSYFKSDGDTWRMVRINHNKDLQEVLKTFEVTVLPDEKGGFVHNTAFYLFNQEGKLDKVLDFNSPKKVVNTLLPLLENS
jgi:protein SCO1/2